MISVGIDVLKGKSTVCIVKPNDIFVDRPKEYLHTQESLQELAEKLERLGEEFRIVLEATGAYHLPILLFLKECNFFVSVINPLEMKRYRCQGVRNVKTDKADSIIIANYGIDYWYRLKNHQESEENYKELRLLGRQYQYYMKMRIQSVLGLGKLLDQTMPGINKLPCGWNKYTGKDKLSDFVKEYWHYDNIRKKSEKSFINSYMNWAKKKGYHQREAKAKEIYALALSSIPIMSSNTPSTKYLYKRQSKPSRILMLSLQKFYHE